MLSIEYTDEMIDQILRWANQEDNIRAVVLQGSHAKNEADALSDYDVILYTRDSTLYTKDEQWLSKIGKPWVCVHEKIHKEDHVFPSRLVIFEGGTKVDFVFYPLDYHKLESPCSFMLDKDGLEYNVGGHKIEKPTQAEFERIVKEFWFEAYHVAKYLKREDLWLVKSRSRMMEQFLLQMIVWNSLGESADIPENGKNMKSWVKPETWNELQKVFAHFDKEDSQTAFINMMVLFRRLATETAELLGYSYLNDVDKNISEWALALAKK